MKLMKLNYNEIMYIYDGCALYLGECQDNYDDTNDEYYYRQKDKALNYMCNILDDYGIGNNPKPAIKMLYNLREYYRDWANGNIKNMNLFQELTQELADETDNNINKLIDKVEKEFDVKLGEDYKIDFD